MIATLLWNALWQGTLICAVTLLALQFVPPANASTRYAAWFVALFALVGVPVLTTTVQLPLNFVALARAAGSSHGTFSLVPLGALDPQVTQWLQWPGAFTSGWLSTSLLILWCSGTSLGLIRLAVSLGRIAKLRRDAAEIGRIDGVPVLASAELSIPIATGMIAPAILLPCSLARSLTPEDRRCAIEHELAHVRRWDVAANAVQRVLETFFFWNPWVHVVGRHLLTEREAACDDWAVQRLGEPNAYAFCLAELARRIVKLDAPLLTPSAIGSRNALVARIERLLSERAQPESKLNYFAVGGIAVLFIIMALVFQTIVPAQAQITGLAADAGSSSQIAQAACKDPDTSPEVIDPVAPSLPKSQWPSHKVTAVVLVKVGSDGRAHGVTVDRSSGNVNVDRAVVVAAEKSIYAPRLVNCKLHSGTYLFKADFGP